MNRRWQLFSFFSLLLGTISCVSWSTLTASQLSAINPTSFGEITEEQLASIPPQAFAGFNDTQLAAIPAASIRGLNALQMRNLFYLACSGFTRQQFAQISAPAITGFTADCMGELEATSIADISAEQLSAFSGEVCNIFWPGLVHNIPAEAFAGLTPECAGNFTRSAVFSITAERLSFMPVAVFERFSPVQILYIPGAAFSMINMWQLAAIKPESCESLESRHVMVMPAASAPGLTPGCAAKLSISAISGLSGEFLGNMTARIFSVFTAFQLGSFSPSVESIRADQLAALNPESCSGFISHQTSFFPPAQAHGLTSECFSFFTALGCRGLTTQFITLLNPFTGSALTAVCLREFTSERTCGGFTAPFVAFIRPEVFTEFTFDCVSRTRSNAFQLVSPLQIRYLSVEAFAGFKNSVQYMTQEALKAASVDQLANLPRGLGGMTADQMAMIVNRHLLDIVNRWSEWQLSAVNISGFKRKIPEQVPPMTYWPSVSFSNITWLQIALLRADTLPDFTPLVIADLPGQAAAGFRIDHVQALTLEAVSTFSVRHSQHFVQDITAAFSAEQLMALNADTFGGMSLAGIIGIRPEVIPSITAQQIERMTSEQLSAMSCEQLTSFTETQVSHFNDAQREVLQRHSAECETIPQSDEPSPTSETPIKAPLAYFPSSKIVMVLLICLTGLASLIGLIVYLVGRRRNKGTSHSGSKAEPLITKYSSL